MCIRDRRYIKHIKALHSTTKSIFGKHLSEADHTYTNINSNTEIIHVHIKVRSHEKIMYSVINRFQVNPMYKPIDVKYAGARAPACVCAYVYVCGGASRVWLKLLHIY